MLKYEIVYFWNVRRSFARNVCVLGKLVSSCKHAKFIRYMNENANESVIKRTHFYSMYVCWSIAFRQRVFCSLYLFCFVSEYCTQRSEKQISTERCLLFYTSIRTHTHTRWDWLCVYSKLCVCVVEVCRRFVSVELTHCIREI